MVIVNVKLEFPVNKLTRKISRQIRRFAAFKRLFVKVWQRRKKDKRPKILKISLVKVWFILSLFELVALFGSLALFNYSEKFSDIGVFLIMLIFIFLALVLVFTTIFAIVFSLNFFYRFTASLIESITTTLNCHKHFRK